MAERPVVVTDGAGDRYEVVGSQTTFWLRPESGGETVSVGEHTLRQLGVTVERPVVTARERDGGTE